jgi:uncharacterized protein DUF5658
VKTGSTARLWRLFWILALLQAIDLITTYGVLSLGGREGNFFMRKVILTPMAPLLKTLALIFFALLIIGSTARGRPSPQRLTLVAFGLVALYLLVVINNVSHLFLLR